MLTLARGFGSVFLLAALLGLSACKLTQDDGRPEVQTQVLPASTDLLNAGEFVSSAYIAKLKETRSTNQSVRYCIGGLCSLGVKNTLGRLVMVPNLRFHEGDSELTLYSDGVGRYQGTPEKPPLKLRIETKEAFWIVEPAELAGRFERFESMEAFQDSIRRTLIVGRYVDPDGRVYTFRPDGLVELPKREFTYKLISDDDTSVSSSDEDSLAHRLDDSFTWIQFKFPNEFKVVWPDWSQGFYQTFEAINNGLENRSIDGAYSSSGGWRLVLKEGGVAYFPEERVKYDLHFDSIGLVYGEDGELEGGRGSIRVDGAKLLLFGSGISQENPRPFLALQRIQK